MAVSVAVCEIFSVKEWRDLENQVRGRSRSLKMAPFDSPYATFYWSAIVNTALSCTIFEFFMLNNRDLCEVSTKPEVNYLLRSVLIGCSWWNFRSTFNYVVFNDQICTERLKLAVKACSRSFYIRRL